MVFLIGYLLAAGLGRWERQRILEGTVAHYGIWKGLRPGLHEALLKLEDEIKTVDNDIKTLAGQHVELAGDETATTAKEWKKVRTRLLDTRRFVGRIDNRYSLTPRRNQGSCTDYRIKIDGHGKERESSGQRNRVENKQTEGGTGNRE